MTENEPTFTATMAPEDAARYWHEQYLWISRLHEEQRALCERLGEELRETATAVRVLTRLIGKGVLP